MYEIAKATAHTPFARVESTAGLAEVRHWRQLAVDGPRRIPAAVEGVAGFLRRVFIFEARVDVTD